MDLGNYGIGGNEVKIDASEGIAEIPQNRTLLVEQLTKDEPVAPEVIAGLTNIDEVFAHFRPEIDIEFSDAEGGSRRGKFPFSKCRRFFCQEDDGTESFLVRTECGETVCGQDGEVIALQQGVAAGTGKSGDTRGFRQCDFRHSGRFEEQREV